MVAYLKRADDDPMPQRSKRSALSHDLFHGLTPQQLDREARDLAEAEATPPEVRTRLEARLVERLKTPVDKPSWGPDWVRHGDRHAPKRRKPSRIAVLLGAFGVRPKEHAAAEPPAPLTREELDDTAIISRNLEKSRQVWGYRPLYVVGTVLAVTIALVAMFVDYQIIHGDVWTRALSNEFMQVPAIVAGLRRVQEPASRLRRFDRAFHAEDHRGLWTQLADHRRLRHGADHDRKPRLSRRLQQHGGRHLRFGRKPGGRGCPAIQLHRPVVRYAGQWVRQHAGRVIEASAAVPASREVLGVPQISQASLANADSWIWLAFASVIFFIVTTVAALYLQTAENNVRNFLIARDYAHRSRNFAQLHLLELADRRQGTARAASHA